MQTSFEITGLKETLQVFQDLENEIGDKKARSKVLIPSVREAMKSVLAMAKSLSPKDTGLLERTLTIVARRPNRNDKKSKYINKGDSVISIVTTKPIPKKLKQQSAGMSRSEKKKFYASKNRLYDARAVANEFGTANMNAKPFMRVSLESQSSMVATKLGELINQNIRINQPSSMITSR